MESDGEGSDSIPAPNSSSAWPYTMYTIFAETETLPFGILFVETIDENLDSNVGAFNCQVHGTIFKSVFQQFWPIPNYRVDALLVIFTNFGLI